MAAANTSFSPTSYLAILKAKQGELGALASVPAGARDTLIPLLETGVDAQAGKIATAWPDPSNVVLVHALNIPDDREETDWAQGVTTLFEQLRGRVTAVPVLTGEEPPIVIGAVADIASADGHGVCIRLDAEDVILTRPGAVGQVFDSVMEQLRLGPPQCDLLLDVGLIRDSVAARVAAAEAALRVVPWLMQWRNVVCAFSAFPSDVGSIAPHASVTRVSRDDALAFVALTQRGPERVPTYSDYAIGTPYYVDAPWTPIPSIKYTTDDGWMIHRGATRQNRNAQYVELAQEVVGAAYFRGPAFSAGDQYLRDVAAQVVGPGNPTTYVRMATSHHLACVADRLARIGEP